MSSPGVVTFDPPVASIPFKNIIVRITPSGTSSPCKACHRLHPSSVRKTRKVARRPDGFVCGRTAQLIPPLHWSGRPSGASTATSSQSSFPDACQAGSVVRIGGNGLYVGLSKLDR